MPPPISENQRQRVLELARAGKPRNGIAREIGVSASSVSRICHAAGFFFDRSETKAATEAKVADAKARRRGIIEGLYGVAERELARLKQDEHELAEVSMATVVRFKVTKLPGGELYRIVGAINSAASTAVKLEQVDSDTGAESAKSVIGALAAGLGAAYDQLQHEEQDRR